MGCYLDSNPRDLPLLTFASLANNVELCVSTCANMGYKYAAVQFGYAIILKINWNFFFVKNYLLRNSWGDEKSKDVTYTLFMLRPI